MGNYRPNADGSTTPHVVVQYGDLEVAIGNPLPVSIFGTVPLPTGAATAANQATEITALQLLSGCVQTPGLLYTFSYGVRSTGAAVGAVYFDGAAGTPILNVGGNGQQWTGVNPSGTIYAAQVAPVASAVGAYDSAVITTNATTVVKSGACTFALISINTKGGSGNTLTAYDNTAASGTKIINSLDTTSALGSIFYMKACSTGLTIVTAGGTPPDITVMFK